MMPTVAVTRYVTPLREGGSLPGLVEADDSSTVLQSGPVHGGLTADPERELGRLLERFVG